MKLKTRVVVNAYVEEIDRTEEEDFYFNTEQQAKDFVEQSLINEYRRIVYRY